MPPEDEETAKQAYNQILELMGKLNNEASTGDRLLKIETQYKTGEEITKMIWSAITQNEKNINKNKINWNAIIQGVIISVASGGFMYLLLRGGS